MRTIDLGHLDYHAAYARQQDACDRVRDGGEEVVFLVEHPPTITLGRRAEVSRGHILRPPHELRNMNVAVVESDRGGDVTFHGPGQLVAYPVLRLADRGLMVGSYMQRLQQAVVDALAVFGVEGHLQCGAAGVWVEDAKVCAVGVRVRRGVTLHGLALNVDTPMHYFELIDPCGLGRPVTSMKRILGERYPSPAAVKPVLGKMLLRHFA